DGPGAVAGCADRCGRNSAQRNLESILLPATHRSTRNGARVGSGASDGGLALRAVRQRRRSRTRTGAFDTRAPGVDGGRSGAISSHGSQRDCGARALLRIAGSVVEAGGAELPAWFRIVRV